MQAQVFLLGFPMPWQQYDPMELERWLQAEKLMTDNYIL